MDSYVIVATLFMFDSEIRIAPEFYCETITEAEFELQRIFSSKLCELHAENIEYRKARCDMEEGFAEIRGIETVETVENWVVWAILPIKRKENT